MPGPTPGRRAAAAPPPTEARLQDAAVAHLARFAATRDGLARVLARRVDRWMRAAEGADAGSAQAAAAQAKAAIPAVVERLVAGGALDDATFASGRARSLTRAGRSRRAVDAHLAARGVGAEDRAAALADGDDLAAAVATARRRRIGPFRRAPHGAAAEPRDDAAAEARRELGALARAGFSQEVARAALALDIDTAEALIAGLRRP